LPLAVRRKRFLVPLWVFCFGMTQSPLCGDGASKQVVAPHHTKMSRGEKPPLAGVL
jgi:hypothetical protein